MWLLRCVYLPETWIGFLMYQSRTELLHREGGRGLFHLLKYLKKLVYTRALDVKKILSLRCFGVSTIFMALLPRHVNKNENF